MVDAADWRLQGQERYLKGVTLVRRSYRQNPHNPNWDHDHCEFCWAKFSLDPNAREVEAGYCTPDDYRWICEPCFDDFNEMFDWKIGRDRDPRTTE